MQAALKTIGDEDKYFTRVSLRFVFLFGTYLIDVKPFLSEFQFYTDY
jgi:hypothetical protein